MFHFLGHLLNRTPSSNWLCRQSITYKTKYVIAFPHNGYFTHCHTQNILEFFQNVIMWLKTFKDTCHDECFFFWCKILHKHENRNMKRQYLIAFSMLFFKKRVATFLKILKNLIPTFPYCFGLVAFLKNVEISSCNLSPFNVRCLLSCKMK